MDAGRDAGRWYPWLAKHLGWLALVDHFSEVQAAAERVLRDAPASAFAAWTITNIPHADLAMRELPDADQTPARYPHYQVLVPREVGGTRVLEQRTLD